MTLEKFNLTSTFLPCFMRFSRPVVPCPAGAIFPSVTSCRALLAFPYRSYPACRSSFLQPSSVPFPTPHFPWLSVGIMPSQRTQSVATHQKILNLRRVLNFSNSLDMKSFLFPAGLHTALTRFMRIFLTYLFARWYRIQGDIIFPTSPRAC